MAWFAGLLGGALSGAGSATGIGALSSLGGSMLGGYGAGAVAAGTAGAWATVGSALGGLVGTAGAAGTIGRGIEGVAKGGLSGGVKSLFDIAGAQTQAKAPPPTKFFYPNVGTFGSSLRPPTKRNLLEVPEQYQTLGGKSLF